MIIAEVMTTNVRTCSTSDTLMQCAQQMRDFNVGCIPVTEENGRLSGIITDRDITCRAVASGADCSGDRVGNFMTPSPVTVSPDASLEEAAGLMSESKIRRLPVLENGRLVGIVSLGDVSVEGSEQAACHTLHEVSMPLGHGAPA